MTDRQPQIHRVYAVGRHTVAPPRFEGSWSRSSSRCCRTRRPLRPTGRSSIGGCSVLDLAAEFGTPAFVYDAGHIRSRCRRGRRRVRRAAASCTPRRRSSAGQSPGSCTTRACSSTSPAAASCYVALAVRGSRLGMHVARQQQERRGAALRPAVGGTPHRRRQLRRARPARRAPRRRAAARARRAAARHARRARPHARVHRHRAGRLEVRLQPRQRRRGACRGAGRDLSRVGEPHRVPLPHRLQRVRGAPASRRPRR